MVTEKEDTKSKRTKGVNWYRQLMRQSLGV